MDIDNALFYTLSCIPQCLSALLGLFGIFILFRIEHYNDFLFGTGKSVLMELGADPNSNAHTFLHNQNPAFGKKLYSRLDKSIERKDVKNAKKWLNEIAGIFVRAQESNNTSYSRLQNTFNQTYTKKEKLIKQTIIASIWIAANILVSVIMISFHDFLVTWSQINIGLFLLTIILPFIISIALVVYIISCSIKTEKYVFDIDIEDQ